MADARSLLRAHRAANRIDHPFAAYSDSGKLLCKVCREAVKSESLWDNHIGSSSHRQRAAAASSAAEKTTTAVPETSHNKRKHDDADAMDIEEDSEDIMPRKRNRTTSSAAANNGSHTPERNGNSPSLSRRASMTPAHGIEISIPSRPATPLVPREGSRTPTPNMVSMGRSPLMAPTSAPFAASSATSQIPPISTERLPVPGQVATAAPSAGSATAAVDEAEWAAFEAEMAVEDAPAPTTAAAAYRDATISAPALTAEEVAAKSQDEENERRKQLLDAQIADEREDATRALEDEFDEMAQLESRVRRLKERRELLRKGGLANGGGAAAGQPGEATTAAATGKKAALPAGKENAAVRNGAGAEDDEDEDDEDDDDDDDWDDGFRFRV